MPSSLLVLHASTDTRDGVAEDSVGSYICRACSQVCKTIQALITHKRHAHDCSGDPAPQLAAPGSAVAHLLLGEMDLARGAEWEVKGIADMQLD